MKTYWFKKIGWFYCPVSITGLVIAAFALVFCAQVFWAVDRHSHSASDTLYGIFPFWVCTFMLFDWLASRTSKESS